MKETYERNCTLCRLPKLVAGACGALDCPQGRTPLTTPAQMRAESLHRAAYEDERARLKGRNWPD